MAKILTPAELLETYKQISQELLPEEQYQHEIPRAEIDKELTLLKGTLHHQRFIFILNLHKMTIENCYGVERWLGYPDHSFTLYDYLKAIHPSHRLFHQITSQLGISSLMKGEFLIEFMKHRLITFIALQHKNGKYFLFKRVGSVFQYFKRNGKHHLLEYVNEFTLLKEFDESPGAITTFNENEIELKWKEMMMQEMKKVFENKNSFSVQEYRVLREYAFNPSAQITGIAHKLDVKASTILTYHKRIITKAYDLFSIKFDNVKDVSRHLQQQGFL